MPTALAGALAATTNPVAAKAARSTLRIARTSVQHTERSTRQRDHPQAVTPNQFGRKTSKLRPNLCRFAAIDLQT
jgi:hypothetical protein